MTRWRDTRSAVSRVSDRSSRRTSGSSMRASTSSGTASRVCLRRSSRRGSYARASISARRPSPSRPRSPPPRAPSPRSGRPPPRGGRPPAPGRPASGRPEPAGRSGRPDPAARSGRPGTGGRPLPCAGRAACAGTTGVRAAGSGRTLPADGVGRSLGTSARRPLGSSRPRRPGRAIVGRGSRRSALTRRLAAVVTSASAGRCRAAGVAPRTVPGALTRGRSRCRSPVPAASGCVRGTAAGHGRACPARRLRTLTARPSCRRRAAADRPPVARHSCPSPRPPRSDPVGRPPLERGA